MCSGDFFEIQLLRHPRHYSCGSVGCFTPNYLWAFENAINQPPLSHHRELVCSIFPVMGGLSLLCPPQKFSSFHQLGDKVTVSSGRDDHPGRFIYPFPIERWLDDNVSEWLYYTTAMLAQISLCTCKVSWPKLVRRLELSTPSWFHAIQLSHQEEEALSETDYES